MSISIITAMAGLVALGTYSPVDAHNGTQGNGSDDVRVNWYKFFENTAKASFATSANSKSDNSGKAKFDAKRKDMSLKAWLLLQLGLWKYDTNGQSQSWKNNTWAVTALEANNYTAFQLAVKGTKREKLSQDQFTRISIEYNKQKAILNALDTNNYNAYVEATKPTQAEFDLMVAKYKKIKADISVKYNK